MRGRAPALLLGAVLVLVVAPVGPSAPQENPVRADGAVTAGDSERDTAGDSEGDTAADTLLARAVAANGSLPHEGDLVVVSFSDQGPRIARLDVAFGGDGLRIAREGGGELGRVDGRGFPRSPTTLLQVGGVERVPIRLDRLHGKYATSVGSFVELDTGRAVPLTMHERSTGTRRETLYADERTGLIVRRETYGRDGAPVRVVAYTVLDVVDDVPTMTPASGPTETEHDVTTADLAALHAAGFVVPPTLPLGYELVTALDVPAAHVPTLHLIYGDGMYTMSVFQQRGRMAPAVTDGATELRTPTGGAVWRWPGSEPRRIVWNGDGVTFTVLADTPTDELLEVVTGLPTDPPPSILDRLDRGLARIIRWIPSNDRSDT